MGVVNYLTLNGEIVSETRNGVERDYLPEPLGSTAALLDSGGITDTFSYWPYGEVRTHTGSSTTPFQYVGTLGYYTDADRLYVRARYLQPNCARWLTVDPLWPNEKAYGYVDDSPVSLHDISGLALCLDECDQARSRLNIPPGAGFTLCPSCKVCYPTTYSIPTGIKKCIKEHEDVHCAAFKAKAPYMTCTNGVLGNTDANKAECPGVAKLIECMDKNYGKSVCKDPKSDQCSELRRSCLQIGGKVDYGPLPPLKCSISVSTRRICRGSGVPL